MRVLRTPPERFAGLPGFPWPARELRTSDGLTLATIDEGPRDAPVVLLLHGEPTWSFLYRTMLPPLLDAGFRVVAPDNIGFGRSDKPADVADHTYAAHVEWLRSALLDDLGLRDVVLFGQDWGGLLGLRLLALDPDRFRAVCVSNTGLPDGTGAMSETWKQFRAYVDATPDLPVGGIVAMGCASLLPSPVVAGYDAPFPDADHKAGPRAMPGLVPQGPNDPAVPDQRAAWQVLERYDKPFLTLFGDSDPITAGADRIFRDRVPGTRGQPHDVLAGGGHFIQEDLGPDLARRVASWASGL